MVDRAGRLILLRASSVLAIATLAVLVALSSFHATEHGHSFKTLKQWAWLQLAVLSVLSVSECNTHCLACGLQPLRVWLWQRCACVYGFEVEQRLSC
jgi:hypothetical protein